MNYPNTPSKPVTEHHHGIAVEDPYRWLEDNASPAVRDWATAQYKLTRQVLDVIPQRAKFHARLKELYETATPDYLALQVHPRRIFALKR